MVWTRGLRVLAMFTIGLAGTGCFFLRAELLPPSIEESEWEALRTGLTPGIGGVLQWKGPDATDLNESLERALRESDLFQQIRPVSRINAESPGSADWIVSHEAYWHGKGGPLKGPGALSLLTLGILPDISTWEYWDISRVSRASAPSEPVAWIGIPGTRGEVTGVAAVLLSILPDWEMWVAGAGSAERRMGEQFVLSLAKVLAAHEEGRPPTTDPEVLWRLAEIGNEKGGWKPPPERVVQEQRELERRARDEGERGRQLAYQRAYRTRPKSPDSVRVDAPPANRPSEV